MLTTDYSQGLFRKLKLRDLANYDTIRVIDVEHEDDSDVRVLRIRLRIESNIPLHPYILEKVRELLTALLAHSLEDVEKILNSEIVEIALCDELDNEYFLNKKESSNTEEDEENR